MTTIKYIKLTCVVKTIKTKLTLIIASLLILCISVLSIVSIKMSEKAIRANVNEGIMSTLLSSTKLVEEKLERNLDLIKSLAAINRARGINPKTQISMLESEAKRLGFVRIGFLDLDMVIHYPGEAGSEISLGDYPFLKRALKGENAVSSPVVDSSKSTIEVIFAIPVFSKNENETKKIDGVLLGHKDISVLTNITNSIRYGENGYAWMINERAEIISHKNTELIRTKANFVERSRSDESLRNLAVMMGKMIRNETGSMLYRFQGEQRLFAYGPVEGSGWSLAVGALEKDAMAQLINAKWMIALLAVVVLVIGILIAVVFANVLSKPIRQTTLILKDIAQGEGDLTRRIDVHSKDEVGELVKWFNVFVSKVHTIIANISEDTKTLSNATTELSQSSNTIAANTEEISSQSTSVAAASEQSSANLQSISAATEEMSSSMNVMASAIEELSASFKQVAVSCQKESDIAGKANEEAVKTGIIMEDLGKAAQSIGTVIEVIENIASQTNLLALNATIEAASAGEAGKGFAVVANEVKELAKQTGSAIEDIRAQVESMQSNSSNAIKAIQSISEIIQEINTISHSIVASVDQQNGAVVEISGNVAGVSDAAHEVSQNVAESSNAMSDVARTITSLNDATRSSSQGIQEMDSGINDLARLANNLEAIVGQFKL